MGGRETPVEQLLRPGETCWRVERTFQLAVLIDSAAYFSAARAAMADAKYSIMLLGWDFDPRAKLSLESGAAAQDDTIGALLSGLKKNKPSLDIKILIWDAALPIAIGQGLYPQRARKWLDHGVDFHLDDTPPYGASCHQKIIVVDDEIAFCGGIDFAPDRLDSAAHPDVAPWRYLPSGVPFCARHDVMVAVNGPAAKAFGDLARRRWLRATGEHLPPPERPPGRAWIDTLPADIEDVDIAILRTEPTTRETPAVRECEALYVAAINAAQDLIYLENQYFSSPLISGALAKRLAEPRGPQIILMLSAHSPSYFDRSTMDNVRSLLIRDLQRADHYGRFKAYAPQTQAGDTLIVHSKVAIIDDRLARIGSANLNNRSLGFDLECDLAFEAGGPGAADARKAVRQLRTRLIAHFLGCTNEAFESALQSRGDIFAAIDFLNARTKRLTPITDQSTFLGRCFARLHAGDPLDVSDSWRPWLRYFRIVKRTRRLLGK